MPHVFRILAIFVMSGLASFTPAIFGIADNALYTLMGISSYLVSSADYDKEEINNALFVYGLQLAVNFLWPIFFFRLEWYLFSFFWILLLWM